MKKILTATALSAVLASAAIAESHQPEMSDMQLREDLILSTQGSSSAVGLVVPLIALVVFAAALTAGSGGSSSMYDSVYVSDARLKTDIAQVGVSASGLPIYHYRYKGYDQRFEGVMAQDVLARFPDAVTPHASGYLMVDYSKIDTPLRAIH